MPHYRTPDICMFVRTTGVHRKERITVCEIVTQKDLARKIVVSRQR